MREFYLFSTDQDKKIFEVKVEAGEKLDKESVEVALKAHLRANPDDTLEWTKVCNDTKFVGDDILSFYEMHKENVCKLILKGGKTFYKKI